MVLLAVFLFLFEFKVKSPNLDDSGLPKVVFIHNLLAFLLKN